MTFLDFISLMKAELALLILVFILLFIKLRSKETTSLQVSNTRLLNTVNVLLLLNFIAGFFYNHTGNLFGDMYITNELLALEKNMLNAGMLIISLQAHSWLKDHKHVGEFYMLLISTLIGMFYMISANNLLMFYLGLELSTIPLAALVNFDLEKKRSSEGAFKMIISSAFSSALLLFGMSLLYGVTGTLSFSELPALLTAAPLMIFSFVLLIAGFAFKISAVPFHLWTADVYEGAPVPITSYLSVVSKGAVLFVMASVFYRVFIPLQESWNIIVFIIAILTMLIGNLFALRQNNIKRFLAFSSITQVGFILVGLTGSIIPGSSSVIYFVMVYIFSNLGAFAVVALVSATQGKENLSDYKGFYKNNRVLSWVLAISLFSLAGIPPTAGFFGKFFLLLSGAGQGNYILITIAALNMVISLYYYLKLIKMIFMDGNDVPMKKVAIPVQPGISMIICVVGIVVLGIFSGAFDYIYSLVN